MLDWKRELFTQHIRRWHGLHPSERWRITPPPPLKHIEERCVNQSITEASCILERTVTSSNHVISRPTDTTAED